MCVFATHISPWVLLSLISVRVIQHVVMANKLVLQTIITLTLTWCSTFVALCHTKIKREIHMVNSYLIACLPFMAHVVFYIPSECKWLYLFIDSSLISELLGLSGTNNGVVSCCPLHSFQFRVILLLNSLPYQV